MVVMSTEMGFEDGSMSSVLLNALLLVTERFLRGLLARGDCICSSVVVVEESLKMEAESESDASLSLEQRVDCFVKGRVDGSDDLDGWKDFKILRKVVEYRRALPTSWLSELIARDDGVVGEVEGG